MKFKVGDIRFAVHFGLTRAYARFPDGMILSIPHLGNKRDSACRLYRAWFQMRTGVFDYKAISHLKECE